MIILIDNYDSFSYNLYQMIGEIEPDIKVVRNDEIAPEEILDMYPLAVILSRDGKTIRRRDMYRLRKKAFKTNTDTGICLGHQAICEAYGATVTYAGKLMHGKQSDAQFDLTSPIFSGLEKVGKIGRYHSLAAAVDTIPDELLITAKTSDGEVMAVQHKTDPVYGLQFHPESILTPDGRTMLNNFLNESRRWKMSAHDSSEAGF